jgi:hypothetical protein
MIRAIRFVEKLTGALLATSAICSGNIFVCIVIYFGFVTR